MILAGEQALISFHLKTRRSENIVRMKVHNYKQSLNTVNTLIIPKTFLRLIKTTLVLYSYSVFFHSTLNRNASVCIIYDIYS